MSRPPERKKSREATIKIEVPAKVPEPATRRSYLVLTVLAGPSTGALFSVETDETPIGREAGNAIAIGDPGISGRHARIVHREGNYLLEDLGSTNGSYVNGAAVSEPRRLIEGDRIQLGQGTVLGVRFQDRVELEAQKRLYDSAVRDALTGVHNRRFFDERLAAEVAYAVRHRTNLALVMLDVDHFKRVNDTHGHPGGDAVLRELGAMLAESVRVEDVVARYGGEEFAVLARGLDEARASQLAERLRRGVEHLEVPFEDEVIHFTGSFGVAVLTVNRPLADGAALVGAADAALYLAKQNGRNRVYLG